MNSNKDLRILAIQASKIHATTVIGTFASSQFHTTMSYLVGFSSSATVPGIHTNWNANTNKTNQHFL